MTEIHQPAGGDWKHGKFDCCEDIPGILCAMFCTPCYVYKTAEATGEEFCCNFMSCMFPLCGLCIVRGRVRDAKGIPGSPFGDFCTMALCGCCSAIQLNREYTD